MNTRAESVVTEQPTGLEDVTRSVRAVLRATRSVGEASADVLERELAMAISISEQIRDKVVSEKMLKEARSEGLPARLRSDAHRALDLAADTGAIFYNSALTFLEKFADERREPLASLSPATNKLATAESVSKA
jgi:butyrate kinase